jgi:FtsH-binding integral membrane protein
MASYGLENFFRSLQDNIEPPVQHHLKNVYSCLSMITLVAALGGYLQVTTGILQDSILVPLSTIGLLFWLMSTPDDGKNASKRLGMLFAFAMLSGIGIGPLLNYAIHIDPTIVPTALLGSAIVFISFTLGSLYSTQRYYLFLSGTLMSALSLTLVLGIASMLFRSAFLFQAQLYLGLFVMCGCVVYDTQLIVEKRRRGDKDFIKHSLDLFIDLMGIFRRLLIILSQKEQNKRRRSD